MKNYFLILLCCCFVKISDAQTDKQQAAINKEAAKGSSIVLGAEPDGEGIIDCISSENIPHLYYLAKTYKGARKTRLIQINKDNNTIVWIKEFTDSLKNNYFIHKILLLNDTTIMAVGLIIHPDATAFPVIEIVNYRGQTTKKITFQEFDNQDEFSDVSMINDSLFLVSIPDNKKSGLAIFNLQSGKIIKKYFFTNHNSLRGAAYCNDDGTILAMVQKGSAPNKLVKFDANLETFADLKINTSSKTFKPYDGEGGWYSKIVVSPDGEGALLMQEFTTTSKNKLSGNYEDGDFHFVPKYVNLKTKKILNLKIKTKYFVQNASFINDTTIQLVGGYIFNGLDAFCFQWIIDNASQKGAESNTLFYHCDGTGMTKKTPNNSNFCPKTDVFNCCYFRQSDSRLFLGGYSQSFAPRRQLLIVSRTKEGDAGTYIPEVAAYLKKYRTEIKAKGDAGTVNQLPPASAVVPGLYNITGNNQNPGNVIVNPSPQGLTILDPDEKYTNYSSLRKVH